jgi:hypothetical protein
MRTAAWKKNAKSRLIKIAAGPSEESWATVKKGIDKLRHDLAKRGLGPSSKDELLMDWLVRVYSPGDSADPDTDTDADMKDVPLENSDSALSSAAPLPASSAPSVPQASPMDVDWVLPSSGRKRGRPPKTAEEKNGQIIKVSDKARRKQKQYLHWKKRALKAEKELSAERKLLKRQRELDLKSMGLQPFKEWTPRTRMLWSRAVNLAQLGFDSARTFATLVLDIITQGNATADFFPSATSSST